MTSRIDHLLSICYGPKPNAPFKVPYWVSWWEGILSFYLPILPRMNHNICTSARILIYKNVIWCTRIYSFTEVSLFDPFLSSRSLRFSSGPVLDPLHGTQTSSYRPDWWCATNSTLKKRRHKDMIGKLGHMGKIRVCSIRFKGGCRANCT